MWKNRLTTRRDWRHWQNEQRGYVQKEKSRSVARSFLFFSCIFNRDHHRNDTVRGARKQTKKMTHKSIKETANLYRSQSSRSRVNKMLLFSSLINARNSPDQSCKLYWHVTFRRSRLLATEWYLITADRDSTDNKERSWQDSSRINLYIQKAIRTRLEKPTLTAKQMSSSSYRWCTEGETKERRSSGLLAFKTPENDREENYR